MRMLLALEILTVKAWACVCGGSPVATPPCQYALNYSAVFTGTVIELTDPGPRFVTPGSPPPPLSAPQRRVRFNITEFLTGLDPNQKEIVIETGRGGGDCGYDFQRGLEYIVYASKKFEGGFSTGICTPTRLVEKAAGDLKYFHQLALLSPVAEIRVTAFDAHGAWGNQKSVLADVRVTINGPGVHESSRTDAAGRAIFAGLPPGEYQVDASLEGYALPYHLPVVRVHPKGCAEVPLPLQLDRIVSGRLLTRNGSPAPGVTVEAVPMRPRRKDDLPLAADSSKTDSNGRYELRHLGAGDYYLGISLSQPPTLQNPYTRWFYPGAEDPALAGILHIFDRPGVQQFDITLPDPQRDRVLQGTVFWPDGRPAEGVNIFLEEDPRWPWQIFDVAATTGKEGRFLTHALDGTRYRIHAVIVANGPISAEPVMIGPGSELLDLKLVLVRKGYSPKNIIGNGLDNWRKGLGLP